MIKKFVLVILVVYFSPFTISTAYANLQCTLEVIKGKNTCNLKHDRGYGNYLHTTHNWLAGNGGTVKPTFTFTGEATKFTCNCNSRTFVPVAVDYTLLILVEKRDAAIIICPATTPPQYDV